MPGAKRIFGDTLENRDCVFRFERSLTGGVSTTAKLGPRCHREAMQTVKKEEEVFIILLLYIITAGTTNYS